MSNMLLKTISDAIYISLGLGLAFFHRVKCERIRVKLPRSVCQRRDGADPLSLRHGDWVLNPAHRPINGSTGHNPAQSLSTTQNIS
jgi:hypothetical protein